MSRPAQRSPTRSDGEPLTRRIVTVAGDAVAAPRNLDALIGTPVRVLLEACGVQGDADALVMGGPMMGVPLAGAAVPVVKGMNALLAFGSRRAAPTMPCIRCGECGLI